MQHTIGILAVCLIVGVSLHLSAAEPAFPEKPSMRVATFKQEVSKVFGPADGLPDGEALSITVGKDNTVYAGTARGVFQYSGKSWSPVAGIPEGPAPLMTATPKGGVLVVVGNALYRMAGQSAEQAAPLPDGAKAYCLAASDAQVLLGTAKGLFALTPPAKEFTSVSEFNTLPGDDRLVQAAAASPDGKVALGTKYGLLSAERSGGPWQALFPHAGNRSWAPTDVRGVAFDKAGRLWFASPQGVGRFDGEWTLYTPEDGLPYDDFTTVAVGDDDAVWFGTTIGAIRFDGKDWEYREGRRWLPDDPVRAIAVNANGDAWFATPKGVAVIERQPMTLAQKAKFYEDEIDKYHRRTEYGYVLEVTLKAPGDKSGVTQSDSDNDGLWTSMYGAGECFAYGATKSPDAKKRAKSAFEALRFLNVVTQGGNPPALPGFVARSVLPTSGPDPNANHSEESDRRSQKGDALWKVLHPRWPKSADGKWYWKADTSSDELDGHYFFYAAYYDLVADTDQEKQRVRDLVASITDHLVDHGFNLVDWDGKPTRWAIFGPDYLDANPSWFPERGLNSLSILSYLSVAAHITGNARYTDAFNKLVKEHGYAMNMMYPKLQAGPGSNNQSDDEMAFMSYYDLVKYSPDPVVRAMTAFSFRSYWDLEEPELNPFFNFAFAGACLGTTFDTPYQTVRLTPTSPWLEQSVDTLVRFPLDRCNWALKNSHRKDILPLPEYRREDRDAKGKGYRRNGYVLPVDERHFNHWNCDPWDLDERGKGNELADGAVYLLPYYMGLYHKFITE